MNRSLVLVLSLFAVSCGMFSVKQGQCFKYCLDFDAPQIGEPVGLCYGTPADLQAAKVHYESIGRKVTVRK
jgi:hypothetical protein